MSGDIDQLQESRSEFLRGPCVFAEPIRMARLTFYTFVNHDMLVKPLHLSR